MADSRTLSGKILRPAEAPRIGAEKKAKAELATLARQAASAYEAGRTETAADLAARILDQDPNDAIGLQIAGVAVYQLGRYEEAIPLLSRAVSAFPERADLHNALGAAFLALDRLDDATAAFETAVRLDPNFADAYYNMGCAYQQAAAWREAARAYAKALKIKPFNFSINNNLAVVLDKLDYIEEQIACLRRALEVNPVSVTALCSLGRAYRRAHRLDTSLRCFDLALHLDPDHADGHFGRARTLLFMGRYPEGFEEYEWRWKLPDCPPRGYARPLWDGRADRSLTVLLHHEQGHGDTLQFIRYAALVKERVGRIVVEAPEVLLRLVLGTNGIDQVVTDGADADFDVYAPIGSLPGLLGTTVETIPAKIPYLRADPRLVARWAERISGPGLRVGLVWAGNPRQPNDARRSTSLAVLAELGNLDNVSFYLLQLGPGRKDLADPPSGLTFEDLGPDINDFADTAAIVENLDLVITVCTSVAHLAGGLGRPTWTMLCHTPDWRWFLDRADSPWYPTMRLFRQQRPGDWEGVIRRLKPELAALAQKTRRR